MYVSKCERFKDEEGAYGFQIIRKSVEELKPCNYLRARFNMDGSASSVRVCSNQKYSADAHYDLQ